MNRDITHINLTYITHTNLTYIIHIDLTYIPYYSENHIIVNNIWKKRVPQIKTNIIPELDYRLLWAFYNLFQY